MCDNSPTTGTAMGAILMGDPTKRSARLRTIASVAIVAAVVVLSIQVPRSGLLLRIEAWVVGLGPWGPPAFAAIYALALAIYLPALPFTLACGALFGPVVGSITAWIGSTVGAGLGFLVVRYLARESVARRIRRHPKFAAFDEAVARSGWKVVALLRLTPMMPYVTMNAIAGASAIRFWPFLLATAFGKLPGTIAVVYSGHVGRQNLDSLSLQSIRQGPWAFLSMALSLIGTIASAMYITHLARRAIAAQVGRADEAATAPTAESADSLAGAAP